MIPVTWENRPAFILGAHIVGLLFIMVYCRWLHSCFEESIWLWSYCVRYLFGKWNDAHKNQLVCCWTPISQNPMPVTCSEITEFRDGAAISFWCFWHHQWATFQGLWPQHWLRCHQVPSANPAGLIVERKVRRHMGVLVVGGDVVRQFPDQIPQWKEIEQPNNLLQNRAISMTLRPFKIFEIQVPGAGACSPPPRRKASEASKPGTRISWSCKRWCSDSNTQMRTMALEYPQKWPNCR